MSYKNYEANGYGCNLDLLIILHSLRVSYTSRSGCREKSIQITHVYLICQKCVLSITNVRTTAQVIQCWDVVVVEDCRTYEKGKILSH
jgi:hypothetical protein